MERHYISATRVLRKGRPLRIAAEQKNLYETLSIVLIALWFVCLGIGVNWDGWIHILLLGALAVALLKFWNQGSQF